MIEKNVLKISLAPLNRFEPDTLWRAPHPRPVSLKTDLTRL